MPVNVGNGFGPEESLPVNPTPAILLLVNHEGLPLMDFYYRSFVSIVSFRVEISKSRGVCGGRKCVLLRSALAFVELHGSARTAFQ